MRISQILQRSANLYPEESRLFLVAGERFVNYKDSWSLSECYKSWIRDLILKYCGKNSSAEVDIVVALLSHNSPECFLTMMGSIANHYCPCQKSITKEKQLVKEPCIITAMLNVRWTPNEIARALAVEENLKGNDDIIGQKGGYLTIVLYGQGMEEKARDACIVMNNSQQKFGHRSVHEPIPEIDSIASMSKKQVEGIQLKSDRCCFTETAHHDALLLFTSGTTSGKPKGVRLSHLSLIIQSMAKLMHPCSYDSSTRMLATTVPLFHVGGISSALAVAMAGGMLIFPKPSSLIGFSPRVVLDSMHSQHSNVLPVDTNTLVIVPAMLHAILAENEKNGKPPVYNNVRLILVGGQSMTSPQLERAKIYFPGARIVQTFACTEAGSSITFSTIVDPKTNKNGAKPLCDFDVTERQIHGSNVGFPPHHIDLQIFRLDANNRPTKDIALPYVIGAIGTKGPHVMNGYWKRGKDILSHGIGGKDWLILNDIGYLDDKGRLFFCGRSNDVIRTGGETVFSPEVERVIIQHPSVDQCAVFALPDEKFGECVSAAIVVKRRNKTHSEDFSNDICLANLNVLRELRDFCANRQLAGYKHPRVMFFCEELPCNSSGKVLKHILASKCAAVRDKKQSKL